MAFQMSNFDNFDIDQIFLKFAQRQPFSCNFCCKKIVILGSFDDTENGKGQFFMGHPISVLFYPASINPLPYSRFTPFHELNPYLINGNGLIESSLAFPVFQYSTRAIWTTSNIGEKRKLPNTTLVDTETSEIPPAVSELFVWLSSL